MAGYVDTYRFIEFVKFLFSRDTGPMRHLFDYGQYLMIIVTSLNHKTPHRLYNLQKLLKFQLNPKILEQ